jgi:hypothetical protein
MRARAAFVGDVGRHKDCHPALARDRLISEVDERTNSRTNATVDQLLERYLISSTGCGVGGSGRRFPVCCLWSEPLHPAVDRHVAYLDARFGQQLVDVSVGQRISGTSYVSHFSSILEGTCIVQGVPRLSTLTEVSESPWVRDRRPLLLFPSPARKPIPFWVRRNSSRASSLMTLLAKRRRLPRTT